MAESFGIERRGRFYEEVGAIRHVVQDHMLPVVGFLARPLTPALVVRGQFRGYRNEEGVARDSTVETFAAVEVQIDSWRWAGVPFYIRAGKALPVTTTEVVVERPRMFFTRKISLIPTICGSV